MNPSFSDSGLQLIEYNKKQLIELLNPIVDIHYVNFQRTAIYLRIQNLIQPFNYSEQNILEKEIRACFPVFIHNLLQLCPAITQTEIIICCLSFRFSMKTIGLCLGCSDSDSIRQHKFRIKHKMTLNSDNSFLFDFIFRK